MTFMEDPRRLVNKQSDPISISEYIGYLVCKFLLRINSNGPQGETITVV